MAYVSGTRDFKFEVPDGWVDRTMVAWSAPPSPQEPIPPNIVVAYDAPLKDETLNAYVDRQLKELNARAKAFRLLLRRDIELKGKLAVEIVFQFDPGGGALKQRQVFAFLPDGRVVSFANTASVSEFEKAEPFFSSMWNSLSWSNPTA